MISPSPEGIKPKLALDIDNVAFRTSEHMSSKTGMQMEYPPGATQPPFVEVLRMKYLKKKEFIPELPLCYSFLFALPILRNYYEIHGISARWDDQRAVWLQKLNNHGLLKDFSGLHFRGLNDTDDQLDYKVKTIKALGAEYAVEDHPRIALALSYDLKGIVMPDRPWNRDILGPNIFRCEEVVDFAILLASYAKPEDLFAERRGFLSNPENINTIFTAQTLGRVSIAVASGVGLIPLHSEPKIAVN